MDAPGEPERVHAIVVGGGPAGLSVGHHLARRGVPFVILDAGERIGDAWRRRWDSLRLLTPARFDGLAGMPFPAPPHSFPTKDAMADYLASYAARFELPVRTGVKVDGLSRRGATYVATAGALRFEAEHVVVATSACQRPRVPAFARELDPGIVQLHSSGYRNPSQLRGGAVLVAGAGNSGAEIALELSRAGHATFLAGRDVGHLPFRVDGLAARFLGPLLLRLVSHRVLTVVTPLGRRVRPRAVSRGGPLVRVRPADLAAARVERAPRVAGVRDGFPLLENDRVLRVANVVWCTGFELGLSWIELPIFGAGGEPVHERGVVPGEPGLYFAGLPFLYALSPAMIHGVGRDAERIARTIAARGRAPASPGARPRAKAAGRT